MVDKRIVMLAVGGVGKTVYQDSDEMSFQKFRDIFNYILDSYIFKYDKERV